MSVVFDIGDIEAHLTLDRDPFQAGLAAARAEARAFARERFVVPLGADTAAAQRALEALSARLDALEAQTATPTVSIDTGRAEAEIAAIRAELAALGAEVEHPVIAPELDMSALGALRSALGALGGPVLGVSGGDRVAVGPGASAGSMDASTVGSAIGRSLAEAGLGQAIAETLSLSPVGLPSLGRTIADTLTLSPLGLPSIGRTIAENLAAPTSGAPGGMPGLDSAIAKAIQLAFDANVGRWRVASGSVGAGKFATSAQLASMLAGLSSADRAALSSDALGAAAAGAGGAGGGGGGGWLGGLLGGAAGGGGGGKNSKGPSLGTVLMGALWGKGGALGLAGFGSIGSLAGLGVEHLAMTGLGLAGSATGGLIGGGLLGLGAAGTMAVGMGTDLAGIGQASHDIRSTVTAMSNLDKAVAVYGANSRQARIAQAQLNYTLSNFSPIARVAIATAAQTADRFQAMFVAVTGVATKTGAQIINQVMLVGEKFLPTIGRFAAQNMAIIQKGLQPLFAWMQNAGPQGGLGIFTDLERIFQGTLPTAVHALTQGLELFAKTVDVAAHYTGGFVAALDRFVTKWNSPPNFARWSTEIGKLIGDFHLWFNLIKAVAVDIFDLFHNDVGTGSAIVVTLTNMLHKLGQWETSTRGRAALHSIFAVHKAEILQLLHLLPPLVSILGKVVLAIEPPLVQAFTAVLKVIVPVVNALASNPFGAWVLGIALLAGRVGLLVPVLTTVDRLLGRIILGQGAKGLVAGAGTGVKGLLGKIGIGGGAAAAGDAAGAGVAGAEAGAAGAGGGILAGGLAGLSLPVIGEILAAIAAVGVGAYELVKHWRGAETGLKAAWSGIRTAGVDTWHALITAWHTVSGAAVTTWHSLVAAWTAASIAAVSVWHSIVGAWDQVQAALDRVWQTIDNTARVVWGHIEMTVLGWLQPVIVAIRTHWGEITQIFTTAWDTIKADATLAWDLIKFAFDLGFGLVKTVVTAGWDTITGLFRSDSATVTGVWTSAWNAITTDLRVAWNIISTVVRQGWAILWPLIKAGTDIVVGIFKVGWDTITTALRIAWQLMTGIIKLAMDILGGIISVGLDVLTGHWGRAWSDIKNTVVNIWNTIKSTVLSIASDFWSGLQRGFDAARGALTAAVNGIWDAIRSAFTSGVNDAISLIDTFISAINWLLNKIPGVSFSIPMIAHIGGGGGRGGAGNYPMAHPHAQGGLIPGYAPGRDTVPAMLSPGEYVLRPEVVKAIGFRTLDEINAAHFASGGLVQGGWSWNPVADLGHAASDVLGLLAKGAALAMSPLRNMADAAAGALPEPVGAIARGVVNAIFGGASSLGAHQQALNAAAAAAANAAAVGGGPGGGSALMNQALGHSMAAAMGWTGAQWTALNNVAMRESGWSNTAKNPTSSAYGIAQNIGGLAGYGPNGNLPSVQIAWMLNYIRSRYGSPEGAWAHELSAGWYAKGGPVGPVGAAVGALPLLAYDTGNIMPPGLSLSYNGLGRPEPLSPASGGSSTPIYLTVQIGNQEFTGHIDARVDKGLAHVARLARSGAGRLR